MVVQYNLRNEEFEMDRYYGEGQQVGRFSEALPFIRQVVSDLINEPWDQHEPISRRNAQIVTTGDERLWLFSVTPGGSENINTTLEQYVNYVSKSLPARQSYHSEVIDEHSGLTTRFYITATWASNVSPEAQYAREISWSPSINDIPTLEHVWRIE